MDSDTGQPRRGDRGNLTAFFSNPLVGIAGSVASVVGLVLAVYFFLASVRYRELVYYVHPAKAVVVKTGEASRIRVLLGGEEISSDVTAAQVAIWNQGNESIRMENVLDPIRIELDPPVPIIEASIRKQSRELVQLRLDQSSLSMGILHLSWHVLENADGGIVQLVYAGGPDTKLRVAGAIEGQRTVRALEYSGGIKSPSEQMQDRRRAGYLMWLNILMAGSFGVVGVRRLIQRGREGRAVWRLRSVIPELIMPVLMVCAALYAIISSQTPEPPFGF